MQNSIIQSWWLDNTLL